jgi:PHD/YefM family antitoxin component YafN of YafNO toxin-antitoxin module
MSTHEPEFRHLIDQAELEPVVFTDPETGSRFVLVRADTFKTMQEIVADQQREREERSDWARLARRARDRWAEENVY